MQQVAMQALEDNQENVGNLVQAFGELANGVLDDFGCDETCFEDCATFSYTLGTDHTRSCSDVYNRIILQH